MPQHQSQRSRNRRLPSGSGSESFFSNVQDTTEDTVREHPVTSTVLAFGAGAAVGLLIAAAIRGQEYRHSNYLGDVGQHVGQHLGNQLTRWFNQAVPMVLRRMHY
jgi:hypothetical protein